MNENAPQGQELVDKNPLSQAEGFSSKLKALEEALEEANALFDGETAGKIEQEIKEVKTARENAFMLAEPTPSKEEELIVEPDTVSLDPMGPPKNLFSQDINENSRHVKNAEFHVADNLKKLAELLKGDEQMTEIWFAEKMNIISDNLEFLWQSRVLRELSGSSEYGEGYINASKTPEAQAIYNEELSKFDPTLNDPSLSALANALRGVKVAEYRRLYKLDQDRLGTRLTQAQK